MRSSSAAVEHQLEAGESGHGRHRHVVGRRPEAAAGDDEIHALVGEEPQLCLDVVGAVAADGDVGQFNAQLEQPVGDPGAVTVLDPSRQHLGSRDNDAGACAHVQRHYGRPVMSFSVTAPKSLRELFDQLGLQEVPSADGTVTMQMPVDERTVNTAGGLQGGLIATMADVTAGQLASRSTPFGLRIATTDLFIRYLRPIKVGPARAVARILRTGKRSVVVQVDIYRGNDDEIGATATVNFAAVD